MLHHAIKGMKAIGVRYRHACQIVGLLFLLLSAVSLRAQTGNTVMLLFAGVPSGSCASVMLGLNTTNGDLYACDQTFNWLRIGPGGTGGAPTDAQYVVMALNGTLTAERRLQGTATEITLGDGGANGDATLSISTQLNISGKEIIGGGTPMRFEGLTDDNIYTNIVITDPTVSSKNFTLPNADSTAVQPLTCGGTDKVSAVSALGVITCTADQGGAGGDSIEVEDGDNLGTFTAIVTTGRFEDSGDINFVNTTNDISGLVRANAVALTDDTTGNYIASLTSGTGLTGFPAAGEGATGTPAFDFSDAGADPGLGAGECRFSNEGVNAAGWVCEGETPDLIETRFRVTDPTVADRIVTIPNADSSTVQPDTGAANNFLTAISALGVISKAQPAFTNLSGTATLAQLPFGAANQILGTDAGATAQEHKTLSVGTAGTDFAIAHAANAITFNLPDASASNRGAVTTGIQTLAGAKTFSSTPTFSTMTAASILFAGTGGVLSQDNTNLFWDDTNKRLGIETNNPSSFLHVAGTLTTASVSAHAARISSSFTGSGNGPFALQVDPTFTPSASISDSYGAIITPLFNPGSSVTITNAHGAVFRTDTSSAAGAITNAFTSRILTPILGTMKPTTQYGLSIDNQGGIGITDAYGLFVQSQSGATNNYAAILNGTVGIGKTAPSARLDVQGSTADSTANAAAFYNSTPTLLFQIRNDGLVVPGAVGQDFGSTSLRWDLFGQTGDFTSLVNSTISGGLATTSHAANANFLSPLRHATDCTAITDGKDGEFCWEADANTIYVCEPSVGGCDTVGEWTKITDNDSGGTPAWNALINSADSATSYLSNAVAETVTFSFESAFGASQQFLIRQQTGNPTAGTLLDVRAADTDVTVLRAGDGTNGITVSQAGALTAEGTGSITATLGDSATAFFGAGTLEDTRLSTNVVLENQANTYTTGAQDFTSATSFTTPVAAAAGPTVSGQIAYDSTANDLEYGDNTVNRKVANLDEAQTFTNKTIDGGTATTTHAAGANFIATMRHATDCTAITDGIRGELCVEEDSEHLYSCQPTLGGCDTAAEWILTGDGGGGGNGFGTIGTAVADVSADTITITDSLSIDLTTTDNPEDLTAAFRYDQTQAGDPALAAETCVFTTDGTGGGGILCEGTTADLNEGLIQWNPTTDKILTLPDATDTLVGRDTSDTLTNKTITAASNAVEADDLICTNCIGTTELDDSGAYAFSSATNTFVGASYTDGSGAAAGSGVLRAANNVAVLGVEVAPAGADCTLTLDATEIFQLANCTLDGGDINAGSVGDTALAAGAVDGGSGGEIADGTVDSNDLATANKTLTKSITVLDPTTAETNQAQWYWPAAVTLNRIACSVDAGTSVTINFDERAEATPNTAGTNTLSAGLVCDTNSQTSCAAGCDVNTISDSGIAADVPHNLQITAVSGTVGAVRIHLRGTIN